MNFSDELKIQLKVYNVGYVQIGNKFFYMNDDGTPNFEAEVENAGSGYDEEGNPIEATMTRFLDFGKCVILPNTSAQTISLADGQQYVYSYVVIAPITKTSYNKLPIEGDKVLIKKKDGTINKEMEVKGFLTLKQRYLKLWL